MRVVVEDSNRINAEQYSVAIRHVKQRYPTASEIVLQPVPDSMMHSCIYIQVYGIRVHLITIAMIRRTFNSRYEFHS